jgi:hypothetical protein
LRRSLGSAWNATPPSLAEFTLSDSDTSNAQASLATLFLTISIRHDIGSGPGIRTPWLLLILDRHHGLFIRRWFEVFSDKS